VWGGLASIDDRGGKAAARPEASLPPVGWRIVCENFSAVESGSMFRHIVLVRWLPEATEEQRQAARDAMGSLASLVPGVRAARCGVNVGSGPNHYDFAAVFDFDDRAAFRAYIDHDAHQAYAKGPVRAAAVASIAVLQHEW
jgi:hypothetical protein